MSNEMQGFNKEAIDKKIGLELTKQHPWRNKFHLEMPFGLINDPNGLCFNEGLYHIFMQWNPWGCEHKHKCWAHVQTRDFVHYKRPELALWPADAWDKDGCYSGSAWVQEGNVQVAYTGNVKYEDGRRGSFQRLGRLLPDGTVQREKLLIAAPPPGYTAHFRDPYYFKKEGREYLLLAGQTEKLQGRVLLYGKGTGGWEFLGPVRTGLTDFGYMWECPNFLQFAEGDVLLFCPQGLPEEPYRFQNLYQSGYLWGSLQLNPPAFEAAGDFTELDQGFDFYAPQAFAQGERNILIGWAGMPEKEAEYPTREWGWMHALTLPRQLSLREGRLYQEPLQELEALRGPSITFAEAAAVPVVVKLNRAQEVQLEVQLGPNTVQVELALAFGAEKLVLIYDRKQQLMTLDRRQMHLGGQGLRRFKLQVDDRLKLHFLVDATLVEFFFQDGAKAATVALFPEEAVPPVLTVVAEGGRVVGTSWSLDSFIYEG